MNPSTLDFAEEEEKFQLFLFELEDRQEAFIENSTAQGYQLDYTSQSLTELERYLTAMPFSWDDKSDEAVGRRLDCWTYLGEVVRQNHGGDWQLSWNDDNSANRGQFVITGHAPVEGVEFTPLRLIKTFIQRGQSGALNRAVQAQVNPTPVDFSDLRE
ncbi:hypothetical protein [Hymenobacter ruricola]|uniref:DUF3806 domain-containing protein n=1 Tax=Hymenobacter ruricola TaxID=2791023 RepID=A0ABS0HYL9_9BACT|nr:hypothetical protein [Hymenobacter ruricola]MBF9219807.1 hypothetical protein [Hymenobacter ruricola]